ncbi:MAG: HAMP domain-containing protein, partial [Bdellovibrionales bacterium]|nr:HAMP domain-containing protein [Bdellovibrionales bacterium]
MTIVLVSAALLTQFYLSITEYKKDKIAYVFEAASQVAKSTSTMIKSDVEEGIAKIQLILRRPLTPELTLPNATKSFIKAEKTISAFYVLKKNINNNFEITSYTSKSENTINADWLDVLAMKATNSELLIDRREGSVDNWILAMPIAKNSGHQLVVVVEFESASFIESFYKPSLQNFYLLDKNNNLILSPIQSPHSISSTALDEIFTTVSKKGTDSFVTEIKASEGEFLVASQSVNIDGYKVLAVIPKQVALEALKNISVYTGLLVLLILGVSIIVSVLGASTLTQNLSKLYKAVNCIIKGDLQTKVDIQSKDEVGVLAKGFNLMTAKIQELLKETAEKARMEGELKTAQTVQSTLFPKDHFKNNSFEVFGFYEPASECGGDWYSYNALEDRAYFWIGDATGHGVSAALITSAAKSASTVIQSLPGLKTSQIMSLMNSAVAETSGGNVLMT